MKFIKFDVSKMPVIMLTMVLTFVISNLCYGQNCDPRWNRTKSGNCENAPIQFEANSPGRTTYEWAVGAGTGIVKGSSSAHRDPLRAFQNAGTYIVNFKASGGAGQCSDTIIIVIKIGANAFMHPISETKQAFTNNEFCYLDSTQVPIGSKLVRLKYTFGDDGTSVTLFNPKQNELICHTITRNVIGCFLITVESETDNGAICIKSFSNKMCIIKSADLPAIQTNNAVKIYPNPVISAFEVKSIETATLKIYSIQGQLILIRKIDVGLTKIDIEHLPKSNYILEIIDSKRSYRQTFMKL